MERVEIRRVKANYTANHLSKSGTAGNGCGCGRQDKHRDTGGKTTRDHAKPVLVGIGASYCRSNASLHLVLKDSLTQHGLASCAWPQESPRSNIRVGRYNHEGVTRRRRGMRWQSLTPTCTRGATSRGLPPPSHAAKPTCEKRGALQKSQKASTLRLPRLAKQQRVATVAPAGCE